VQGLVSVRTQETDATEIQMIQYFGSFSVALVPVATTIDERE